MQCSAVPCSTLQCSTVQCSTVQYSTVQYSTVQYSTLHHTTAQYSTEHYIALRYIALHCMTWHYIPNCITSQVRALERDAVRPVRVDARRREARDAAARDDPERCASVRGVTFEPSSRRRRHIISGGSALSSRARAFKQNTDVGFERRR